MNINRVFLGIWESQGLPGTFLICVFDFHAARWPDFICISAHYNYKYVMMMMVMMMMMMMMMMMIMLMR